jgi:hypothetical protein
VIYNGLTAAEKKLVYWDLMCSLWKLFPIDRDERERLLWDINGSLSEKT